MMDKASLSLTRRGFLGTAMGGATLLAAGPSWAAGKTLNILSHKVHQTVLGSDAGDLLKAWKAANDADTAFSTFDSNPLQDRLFREASLSETDFGVGYLIDNRPTSQIAGLFEPLDSHLKNDPIEEFGDIAPGLVQGMTVDGKLIGIPVRHATQGLFYNEALLEEAGIGAPPTTLEELVDQAKKLTFTSKSGTPVVGMILASDLAVFPVMFARAFGGDFITKDFKLVPDPAAMEKGLDVLRGMFEAGSLPRSYATTKNEDQVTWLQQGRAAFTVLPFARNSQLNNPEQSKFPGSIKAVEFPISAGAQRQDAHGVGRRSVGHGDPEKCQGQGSCLEVHQGSLEQARNARHGNQRQRTRARIHLCRPRTDSEEPACRRRGEGAGQRTRSVSTVPGSGARAGDTARGSAARGSGPQACKAAVAAIVERVKPLMPA